MLLLPSLLTLQALRPAELTAARTATPPVIDGRIDEDAWRRAPVADAFTQKRPAQGQPPAEHTAVRILYDDSAVYVGVVCQQKAPIIARLTRRDREVESDTITIGLDTRGDGRSAVEFKVNAAGVLSDGIYANDVEFSQDWDGIWDARTSITETGWSSELRIPLHVLRYDPRPVQRWGLQVRRYVSALQELDEWSFSPADRVGEVSRFGTIAGMTGLRPANSLELLPFVTAALVRRDTAPGLGADIEPGVSAGLDLRWHITPQLTLNATVYPDFGQVDADPAVQNLGNFEVFFPERRPFFIDGADIFSTPLDLLYTRRIGRAPRAPALLDEAPFGEELTQDPEPAPIYGAMKLVGDLGGGVSMGQLVAVTGEKRIQARRADGVRVERTAAPLTAFKALRLRKNFGPRLQLGMIGMATSRLESAEDYPTVVPGDARSPRLVRCPGGEEVPAGERCFHDAYVAGLDGQWRSPSGDYVISGQAIASLIHDGPPREQPDGTVIASGDHAPAGRVRVAREGGDWVWQARYEGYGRKVDYNDLGYMRRQNLQLGVASVGYRTLTPWWATLATETTAGVFDQETLDFLNLERGVFVESRWKLRSFWEHFVSLSYSAPRFDDREVGDGTALERRGYVGAYAEVTTDPRALVRGELSAWVDVMSTGLRWNAAATVTLRPLPAVELSLAPAVYDGGGEQRYFASEGGVHLFGEQRARSLGLTLRGTYTFTPRLTLEAYAQAFLASEAYSDFTASPARDGGERPRIRVGALRPAPIAAESNPDDESATLNANLVLRWEYRLGSTLFVVYTHGQSDGGAPPPGTPASLRLPLLAPRAASDALRLKLSYWWG